MPRLIHVTSSKPEEGISCHWRDVNLHSAVQAVETRKNTADQELHYDGRNDNAELFIVHDRDVETVVKYLATKFPGKNVNVYNLEMSALAPPAEVVIRRVTADGLLPD